MRCALSVFLISLSNLLLAQSEELVCSEKSRLGNLLKSRSNQSSYYGYNIDYHRCFWRINPKQSGYLKGSVFSAFTITSTADSIGFDLHSTMNVDSIIWQGQNLTFTRSGNSIYCYKTGGWTAGSRDSLTIYYQGKPQYGNGFGYYVWDNHQTGPIIHTLSEPYGAAYWWPCKQTLTDKIDSLDIFISTIPSFKAASNGLLISSDSMNDSSRVYHWKHRYPIATYLVAMASTNYSEFSRYADFYDRPDSLQILNYVFPQSLAEAQNDVPKILPVIRLFDSLFGEYPFMKEKYGHAQFTWGGGMEHQTMSFMAGFSFDLMAHELAHQWFGDKVTCGSWADLWLNEGFATYANALCYKYLRPAEEWKQRMTDIRNAGTAQLDGSVFVQDTNTINRLFSGNLTYNKGAFLLHMLRLEIGDSAFFSAVRKYLAQDKFAYDFALTGDLKQFLEAESGKDLTVFFQRWFYGEGYPSLKINWTQTGPSVKVNITQVPSHPSVPVFELKIPLRFMNQSQDTIVYFSTTSLFESFLITLPFAADTAEFDPEVTILAQAALGGLNLDNINTGQFTIAPNPTTDNLSILTYNNIVDKVEVFDMVGRLVWSSGGDFEHIFGEKIDINLRNAGNGTYITRLYTKKSVTSLVFHKI